MQNADVGMTKEAYLDMCASLGNDPIEEEIPVEFTDFPLDVQKIFAIYYLLQDKREGMDNNYRGKDYSGILDILELYDVPKEDRLIVYELLHVIDAERKALENATRAQQSKSP